FSSASLHYGKGDAFRHCYWNALMTIRFGADQAQKVADSHEDNGNNLSAESKMDLFNNAQGREIGNLYKTSKSANALAMDGCLDAARKGMLQTIS
ncbi:hypothetical protein K493DRAFT_226522, partial [Basidiobolus meristosporus CBS 931.73]